MASPPPSLPPALRSVTGGTLYGKQILAAEFSQYDRTMRLKLEGGQEVRYSEDEYRELTRSLYMYGVHVHRPALMDYIRTKPLTFGETLSRMTEEEKEMWSQERMDRRLAWRQAHQLQMALARIRARVIRIGLWVLSVPAFFYSIQLVNYLFRDTTEALLR